MDFLKEHFIIFVVFLNFVFFFTLILSVLIYREFSRITKKADIKLFEIKRKIKALGDNLPFLLEKIPDENRNEKFDLIVKIRNDFYNNKNISSLFYEDYAKLIDVLIMKIDKKKMNEKKMNKIYMIKTEIIKIIEIIKNDKYSYNGFCSELEKMNSSFFKLFLSKLFFIESFDKI